MLAAFLIVFREAFEALLFVALVLAFLSKKGYSGTKREVWIGSAFGLLAAFIVAVLFGAAINMLSGNALFLFEGISMIIAAGFVTFVAFWALKEDIEQEEKEIEKKVKMELSRKHAFGLRGLAFITVAREGIEAVFLVGVISPATGLVGILTGALAGFIAAFLIVEWLIKHSLKIKHRRFFAAIGILLILFSAGLVAQSVKELQAAGAIQFYKEKVFNASRILPNDNPAAVLLSMLFGYNAIPSFLEIIGYFSYLLIAIVLYFLLQKNIQKIPRPLHGGFG